MTEKNEIKLKFKDIVLHRNHIALTPVDVYVEKETKTDLVGNTGLEDHPSTKFVEYYKVLKISKEVEDFDVGDIVAVKYRDAVELKVGNDIFYLTTPTSVLFKGTNKDV